MDDHAVLQRIHDLVGEEHTLREKTSAGHPLASEDRERLQDLETRLDQLWDLLRRRRAREEFHQDPDLESLQSEDVVEGYEQ